MPTDLWTRSPQPQVSTVKGRGSSVQCPSSSLHFPNNSIFFGNIVSCQMFSVGVAGFHAFPHFLWNPRGENQYSNGLWPIRDSLSHCYTMYISLFSRCSNIGNNLLGAFAIYCTAEYGRTFTPANHDCLWMRWNLAANMEMFRKQSFKWPCISKVKWHTLWPVYCALHLFKSVHLSTPLLTKKFETVKWAETKSCKIWLVWKFDSGSSSRRRKVQIEETSFLCNFGIPATSGSSSQILNTL